MMFDTDVLIWFLRGEPKAVDLIDSTAQRAVSLVTFMELLRGAQSKVEIRTLKRFLRDFAFRVIPLNEPIGHTAAGLIEEYALASGLEVADALIAATAREFGEVLATGNIRHFRPIRNLVLKVFRPQKSG